MDDLAASVRSRMGPMARQDGGTRGGMTVRTTGRGAFRRSATDGFAQLASLAGSIATGSDERSQVQRDVLVAFLVRAASAGILYLTQIVLARWMGRAEYGIYVAVWTMVLVLGGTGNLGLLTAVIRLLPEYRERGDLAHGRGIAQFAEMAALIAGSLIALTGLAVLWLAPGVVATPYLMPLFLLLFAVPILSLSDIMDGIGRAGGWIARSLLPPYVLRPLLVLITMVVAHEVGWPTTAETAATAALLATWLAFAVQRLLVRRRLAAQLPPGETAWRPRAWLAIALPLLGISLSELVLQNADVLVLSRVLPPSEVAVYFAAAKTMSLVMFVHYAVGSAVANRFSMLNARGDHAELAAFVHDCVRWTFWPSLAVAGALLTFGLPLLWLFGDGFTAGYPIMAVLAIGFLGRAAMGPSEFLLNMLGQQRTCAASAALAAATSIALNLLLVPRLGLIGAAMATSTALLTGAMLNTIAARRRLGLEIAVWSRRPA